MKTLGVGIVGCGVISGIYMTNMPMFAGIELRGCADIRPESAKAAGEKFGIPAYTVDQLLARDDIDIVVNLTIPATHFSVSHAALAAGKHVFSEKPLCVTAEDGRRLVAEAEARGLLLGCAPDTFLGAGGRLAREMIDAGRIGKVLAGTAILLSHGMEHWHPEPEFFFKPGGGPILDLGPYYIGALVNLLGPIAKVQAQTAIGFAERIVTAKGPRTGERIEVEIPTTVSALLGFASGAQVSLMMSWDVWKHGHPPIELYGTEGSMRVPDPNFFGGEIGFTERDGEWQSADPSAKPFGKANWRSPNWPDSRPAQANYRCLGLAELARAATTGAAHRSSGKLALHVLEAMQGIIEAGESGKPVAIPQTISQPLPLDDADAQSLLKGA
jgi:predicted dehydrogenase